MQSITERSTSVCGGRKGGNRRALELQLADLGAGEEEGTNAVDLGHVAGDGLGVGADGLDEAEFAVGFDAGDQSRPALGDDRRVGFVLEQAGLDAVGEAVGEEASAGGFGDGVGGGIKQ